MRIPIDKNRRDYNNDPYFVKKAEEASAFLKKHGLPEEVAERIKKKGK